MLLFTAVYSACLGTVSLRVCLCSFSCHIISMEPVCCSMLDTCASLIHAPLLLSPVWGLVLTRKASLCAESIECFVFCFLVRYSGPTWHLSRTMSPLSRDPIPSVTLLPNSHTTISALRTHVHLPAVRGSVRALTLSRRYLSPPKRLGLDQTVTRCLQGFL